MIITFRYGFEYGGFQYGWYKKELYRLPSVSGINTYGFKKMKIIKVGNKDGYRVKRQKLTIDQLTERTVKMFVEVEIIKNQHIPE